MKSFDAGSAKIWRKKEQNIPIYKKIAQYAKEEGLKVDKDDPALKEPRKYIGKSYNKKIAHELAEKHGWIVKEQDLSTTSW